MTFNSKVLLKRDDDGILQLHGYGQKNEKPFSLSLLEGPLVRRFKNASNEILNKCFRRIKGDTVLDATMGWGVDSLLMLALGKKVTSLEQSPLVTELVNDAAKRAAKEDEFFKELVSRWQIQNMNCLEWKKPVHVVFLDPMYRESKRSASLPDKKMQILEELCTEQIDTATLLDWAHSVATEAVILKQHGSSVTASAPSWSINGKLIRYDIFKK